MYIRWLEDTNAGYSAEVGGKNASLGEMIGSLKEKDINVPDGFATTARAYWEFMEKNDIRDKIRDQLDELNSGKPLKQVGESIRQLITRAHKHNRKVGICGQAPSDHPEFAVFLVEEGIDSISLNPDSVIEVKKRVAEAEKKKRGK